MENFITWFMEEALPGISGFVLMAFCLVGFVSLTFLLALNTIRKFGFPFMVGAVASYIIAFWLLDMNMGRVWIFCGGGAVTAIGWHLYRGTLWESIKIVLGDSFLNVWNVVFRRTLTDSCGGDRKSGLGEKNTASKDFSVTLPKNQNWEENRDGYFYDGEEPEWRKELRKKLTC